MRKLKVIDEKLITLAEAKKILDKKKVKEMGYEQKITTDYLRKMVNADLKDIEKAKEELQKMEVLKEHQIINLVNLLPKEEEDVKVIFMKERTNLKDDDVKKILSIIKKIKVKKKDK